MQTIDLFLYKNILNVTAIDPPIFSVRNPVVYSRPIKIFQGIDNPIYVVTKNQDEKPVDLTGYTMEVDIQDYENQLTVASFAVNTYTWSKGLGQFTIPMEVVNALDQEFYWVTAKLNNSSTNKEQPLYIDSNYEARLTLQVLPAYFSSMPQTPQLEDGIIDAGVIGQ